MNNFEFKQTENNVEIVPLQPQPNSRPHSGRLWFIALTAAAVVTAVLAFGILSRVKAAANLRNVTAQIAVPDVAVVQPKPAAPAQEIILPGNMQPLISSPVYARTDGYLKKWYFDIGAHVKAGQLLATIQSPEIDEQLAQARSTLATAEANLKLAEITKTRYEAMFQKHAVSQQDRDNAEGTYSANKAILDADDANMRHYEALVSFEKVYAPFDGVITARNTDIGDLINAGSSSAAKTDLFHIAQTGTLRVYVNVPEEYSRSVKPGQTTADVVLAEFPGQKFPGKVVRTSEAINGTTRTLLTEIDIPNPDNTLLSRSQHLQVGVVQSGKVELADITPGHDFGNQIEVVAGLKPDDQIVVNPPGSLVSGQQVTIVQSSLPGDSQ